MNTAANVVRLFEEPVEKKTYEQEKLEQLADIKKRAMGILDGENITLQDLQRDPVYFSRRIEIYLKLIADNVETITREEFENLPHTDNMGLATFLESK